MSTGVGQQVHRTIVTLGPEGTDAHAEAIKYSADVLLTASFPNAMRHAYEHDDLALVAAGYLERDGDVLVDSWVDLHFGYHTRMKLLDVWQSSTKPMCVAVNADRVESLADARTLALHPATKALAAAVPAGVAMTFVKAKPIAAAHAAAGHVDACIASVDVVRQLPTLRVVTEIRPTMVWCLYGKEVGT